MERSVKVFLSFFFSGLPTLGKGGCSCLLFCKARIHASALSSFSWISEMSFWCSFEPQASVFNTLCGKVSEIKALTWSFCSPNCERGWWEKILSHQKSELLSNDYFLRGTVTILLRLSSRNAFIPIEMNILYTSINHLKMMMII